MPTNSKIKGTIAAGHRQTAEAGVIAYEAGGNAIDAAIAALFASCVTEPCMSGFGGGGFALVRTTDMQPQVLDFFCQTPIGKKEAADLDFEPVKVQFAETTEVFHVGKGAVAVPGVVRGIFELHERLGTVPLKTLVEPAIHLARNGAEVDWFQAYDFELLEVIFKRSPDSQTIFYRDGQRLVSGGTTKNVLFADLLLEMATAGPGFFYEGEIAQTIADEFENGGLLALNDLKDYAAVWRKALSLQCNDFNIYTNPQPSRGGIVIAETLRSLKNQNAIEFPFGSAGYASRMVNALQTGSKRTDDQYTKWGSTTHISTVDELGNAVSVSVSNGEGSGYFIPGSGIQLNNMLGESALFPNGFHSWQPNTRVQSLMSPSVLELGGEAIISLGTGGAGRIPAVLSQVVSHLVFDRVSIREAIERGRMHMHGTVLELEPGIAAPDVLAHPLQDTNSWQKQDMFFGGIHASSLRNGKLESVGDARRNGSVAYSRQE